MSLPAFRLIDELHLLQDICPYSCIRDLHSWMAFSQDCFVAAPVCSNGINRPAPRSDTTIVCHREPAALWQVKQSHKNAVR